MPQRVQHTFKNDLTIVANTPFSAEIADFEVKN